MSFPTGEGGGKEGEEEHGERESRANKIQSGKTATCKCHRSGRGAERKKESVTQSKRWMMKKEKNSERL